MTAEARLEDGGFGLRPADEGWFVVNARDAEWHYAERRGALCYFEGAGEMWQVGVNVSVLAPGQPMAMYHWERDEEDFLVVAGEALLIVEGSERPLRTWDLFHCPPGTRHVIVGAGRGPCVVVSVGARRGSLGEHWGSYVPDPAAEPYGASVESETGDPEVAYAALGERGRARYDGWLRR